MLYKYDTFDMAAVGSFIRSARKMKGHTQASLAEKLKIEPKYLSQLERGKSVPSYPLIMAISDELEVSIDFLTRGTSAVEDSLDKETLFYIPEAKGLSKEEYHFIEKSIRDMTKNLKNRKSSSV